MVDNKSFIEILYHCSSFKCHVIRKRMLETIDFSFNQALTTAKSLELSYDNSNKYKAREEPHAWLPQLRTQPTLMTQGLPC